MAELHIRDVSKIYAGGVRAVSHVNVEVADGEFVILVGPSGCGKSTLLRMIAGLEAISEGEISIAGRVVNNVHAKDRDIAMVFQNYALYPHMTVYENMAFGLKMRKYPKAEIEGRVRQAAETLGLTSYLERKPQALSGGQRQRVAVGRAIVRQPALFLFDEPLSNLDAKLRVSMRAELIKLRRQLSATMIYVTHDQVEAMSMGDRLIVLKDGVAQQIGAPLEIYNRPRNQFVAGFIGSPPMNFINCALNAGEGALLFADTNARVKLTAAQSALLREAPGESRRLILGIRPEDIYERQLYDRPVDGNVVTSRVEFLEPLGNEVLATCALGERELIVRLSPRTEAQSDQPLDLVFDMEQAKLFEPATGEAVL
jgi:multiple sugar transport system ATP-binding protein